MKDIAVVFSKYGARVYHGVDAEAFKSVDWCAINPELPKGVPPHYWKLYAGKIIEMTTDEKKQRDLLIQGLQPEHNRPLLPQSRKLAKHDYIRVALFGASIALLFELFFRIL